MLCISNEAQLTEIYFISPRVYWNSYFLKLYILPDFRYTTSLSIMEIFIFNYNDIAVVNYC